MCEAKGPILLVEDQDADAMLFQRAMQKSALKPPVVRVNDGDKAVEYLEGTGAYSDRGTYPHPSVVVLDIKLRRMTGFEVLEWIRSHPGDVSHTPVIMLSSSTMARDVASSYQKGANAFVTKPYSSSEYSRMTETLTAFWLQFNELDSCPRMQD